MAMIKVRAMGAVGGALALAIAVSAAYAQQQPPAPLTPPPAVGPNSPQRGPDFRGPGMQPDMMRPGMRPPGMMRQGMAMCDERMAGMAQRRIDRIERAIAPTEAQRGAFDAYKAASARAMETMRAACPKDTPLTPTGRLEAQEKMLDARLQAVRMLRAALDPFYRALSDEQKARFNMAAAPRPHFGGGWQNRESMRRDGMGRDGMGRDGMGRGGDWRGPRPPDENRNQRWGRNWGDREGFGDGFRDRGRNHDGKGWRDDRGRGERWRERTGDDAQDQQRAPERLGHIEGEEKF